MARTLRYRMSIVGDFGSMLFDFRRETDNGISDYVCISRFDNGVNYTVIYPMKDMNSLMLKDVTRNFKQWCRLYVMKTPYFNPMTDHIEFK